MVLGKLDGELHLRIDTAVQPTKIPIRKVPLSLKSDLKKELDRLQKLGVITQVTTPTEWISSMVVARKTSGARSKATEYSASEESLPYSNNRIHIARFDERQDFLHSEC